MAVCIYLFFSWMQYILRQHNAKGASGITAFILVFVILLSIKLLCQNLVNTISIPQGIEASKH